MDPKDERKSLQRAAGTHSDPRNALRSSEPLDTWSSATHLICTTRTYYGLGGAVLDVTVFVGGVTAGFSRGAGSSSVGAVSGVSTLI